MVKRDFTRLTPDEKINGIKATKLPDYFRTKYHGGDVRETFAQLSELTIQLGINMGLSPDDAISWARKLQESVSQSEFDSWVSTLLDGGPSIFMNTLSELKAAYPNGAPGVALVRETDPAKIYVWNGSAWENFGDYQGIAIKDGSVTSSKIANRAINIHKVSFSEVVSRNKFDKDSVTTGPLLADGTVGSNTGSTHYFTSDFMSFNPNDVVTSNFNLQSSAVYDSRGVKISTTLNTVHREVTMPANGRYLRITRPLDRIDELMIVTGTMPQLYDPFKITINEEHIPELSGEKIKEKSINVNNLSFAKVGKNLFDKSTAIQGYVNDVLGVISPHDTYYASDYMSVLPSTKYTRSHPHRMAFYDASKNFISGSNVPNNIITTPSNAAYVRHTIGGVGPLDTFQFEEGPTGTFYEPYGIYIGHEYIEDADVNVDRIPNGSITLDKVAFVKSGKNLLDTSRSLKGKYISQIGGSVLENANYEASDWIPVNGGDTLTVSNTTTGYFRYAFYSLGKAFISGNFGGSMTVTAPDDAAYFRFSYKLNDKPQVELGSSATSYEPFGYYLDGVQVKGISSGTTNNEEVNISLPSKLYGVVGKELSIYYNNVIDARPTGLDFDVDGSLGMQMEERWVGTPTAEGTTNLSLSVFKDHKQVSKKDTSIKTVSISNKNLSVLYFGDSTVNAGGVTKRLLELYSEESSNLTLIGTRGADSTNRHEGRGGWSGAIYRTPTEIYGAGNPFYNPAKSDFDFGYYMSQQGYNGLDHFIIQLGINDTFGMTNDSALETKIVTILNDFDFIINDVKSYDPTIKVGVTVTFPPNASQDAFGKAYGNGQTQWRYKRNNAIWTQRLIDHYKDKEGQGIYLVPMQHNIDTTINIADGVHPKQAGYDQIGDSVYAYLKNIG